MRICYLGENGSVHNQKWIEALSKREDVELHVVSFNRGVMLNNVTYHFLKSYTKSKLDYLFNIPELKSIVKKLKPDVLHAHYATSYGFMGASCKYHPFIITGWGADIFDSPKYPFMTQILKYSFKKADAITVLSKITKDEISKLTNRPVQLVPFGVDTNKFIPANKVDENKIRIGTIRTLSEKYGVEYLIRAFSIIAAEYPNVYLEIVGDGELRSSLEYLADELGVAGRVKFHGFINQQTDFEKYFSILSQLDIFAILSILDSETFGVACVEAGSCGIPVVATNVGGLPEVLGNGISGIIVPPYDIEKTALALKTLVENKQLRISMGIAARNYILENYDWEKCVQKMMDIYTSLQIKPN